MISRRKALAFTAAGAVVSVCPAALAQAGSMRLVLVHGRGQAALDADALKTEWLNALRRGVQALGKSFPDSVDVAFPFYGDVLEKFTREFDLPLTSDIRARGSPEQDEFLAFQAELADALRERAGISDAQVNEEYGPNPKPRGPLNWEWVQAILRTLDKHGGGMSQKALEVFTRDVFLYTTRPAVRQQIDGIVAAAFNDQSCIVVAHSLGSIVAYSVLCSARRTGRVPLYVTLGSPLGIRPIRNQFVPIRFPKPPVDAWLNAFDRRDVVALYPLDAANFPVAPPVENYGKVNNHTDNRHGLVGYIDDR